MRVSREAPSMTQSYCRKKAKSFARNEKKISANRRGRVRRAYLVLNTRYAEKSRGPLGERQILAYPLESCSQGATQRRFNCQSLKGDEKFHAERESTDHYETRLVY
jgi:hypothetical protein